jgi:hypothetical protein
MSHNKLQHQVCVGQGVGVGVLPTQEASKDAAADTS